MQLSRHCQSFGMKTLAAFLIFSVLGACGRPAEVSFGEPRTVPKDKRVLVWGAATKDRLGVRSMSRPVASSRGAAAITATTPEGWEQLPANPGRFRNAVWRVVGEEQTDCYLTIGVGGGVASNLQRWYVQQFGMSAAPALDALPVIDFGGRDARLAQLRGAMGGKQGWAALIAFYSEGERVTSLKFTGPAEVVNAQQDAFLALAGSIRLGGPQAAAQPAPADARSSPANPNAAMPAGHVAVSGQERAPLIATTPPGWVVKAGSRRLLHHTAGANTEVYVSQLGGSLRDTLDIWRFELQLPAMTDAEFAALPKASFLGDDAVVMELDGDWRGMTGAQIDGARVLVAARLDGDMITFCKIVGPRDEVAAQRDAFAQFCTSVRKQ